MYTIKIVLKRFFKNKNTVTILGIVLCIGILYFLYNYRIKKQTEPISVPYALRAIEPRTLITADMVGTINVPKSKISSNVKVNRNLVIGSYVSEDTIIPAGSLFYDRALVEWEDLPTSLIADIEKGNTVVSLAVTMDSTYGNSIFPGNYIDLYFSTIADSGKLMLGKLIESIKVLAVVDASGNSVFEKGGELNAPAYLMFAVSEDYHLLLRKASYLSGKIFPVPRNASYSENPIPTRISSSYIENYILSQTVNVAEEDLKNLTPNQNIPNNATNENNANNNNDVNNSNTNNNIEAGGN